MVEDRGEDSSRAINRMALKKAAIRKVDRILSKPYISEREVYDTIRGFFKKHLGVDYEFTHKEIMDELKKVYLTTELKKRVETLLIKISEFEHTTKEYSKEELVSLLADFRTLVDEMIVVHYDNHKTPFAKIIDFFHHLFPGKHHDILDEEEDIALEHQRHIVKMNMLLDNSKRQAETDIKKAKDTYQELMQVYNSLDEEKKNAYYKPVNELYAIIKSKEEY
jgi:hypothetical protein